MDPYSVDTTINVTAKNEVILSAGAIGTPHILLNSGIGDTSDLDKAGVTTIHHLPDVGKGMSDHVVGPVAWATNGTVPPYVYLTFREVVNFHLIFMKHRSRRSSGTVEERQDRSDVGVV